MPKIVDARNLACPQPVMLTLQALEETDEVITIVDNETARENVTRLGASRGFQPKAESKSDGIYITLRKGEPIKKEEPPAAAGTVLFLGSDVIGRGENEQLGSLLMQSFLHTLAGLEDRPESILLMNSGVKLVTQDSPAVGELQQLQKGGVEIMACGTCLSRLGLTDKVAVGQISNMYIITNIMLKAKKVISL